MAQESVILDHTTIGPVKGTKRSTSVEQFLGIQYATLRDGFSRGTVRSHYDGMVDGTVFGPLPISNPIGCELEYAFLQHELPTTPKYSYSDTECLTVNISVPSKQVRDEFGPGLPVLAFIHGGGFVTGSASWPQWDLAALVELSVKAGTPMVAVGINYRLGPFGFMASEPMRDAGYKCNNGIHDQKLALRWIQQHIGGFGGDGSRVTLYGSSIGGVSGFYHLQSSEPLFQQLAAHGGSSLMQPGMQQISDITFGMAVTEFGLESLSPAEQVRTIVEMPARELHDKLYDMSAPCLSVVDGDLITGVPTFSALADAQAAKKLFPGMEWCKTLWMQDSQFDGMILYVMTLNVRDDKLTDALAKKIIEAFPSAPATTVAQLLAAYGLDRKPAESDASGPVLDFLQHISFSQAARMSAEAWSREEKTANGANGETTTNKSRAYLSHFNAPNPWPGQWQGRATHGLDAAFLLQNYNKYLCAGQRAVAERMGREMVAFVAHGGRDDGHDFFPPVGEDGAARVYFAAAKGLRDESRVVKGEEALGLAHNLDLHKAGLETPEILDGLLMASNMLVGGAPV